MKGSNQDTRRLVRRLLAYAALLCVALIVLFNFILIHPYEEALKLLLPGVLASLMVILVTYAFRHTFLEDADNFFVKEDIDNIAAQIVNEVRGRSSSARGFALYERWNDVPWQEVLGEAKEVEILASYMDTWIIQTSDLLQATFARGGTIRAFLPKPGSEAATRVLERFPEYDEELVRHKIDNTTHRLEKILERSDNKRAKLEVYWTTTFCMHCLLRIDKKWLVISPFDHFRRGQIEGPAFVIDLNEYRRLAEWVQKELGGIQGSAEHYRPTTGSEDTSRSATPLPLPRDAG